MQKKILISLLIVLFAVSVGLACGPDPPDPPAPPSPPEAPAPTVDPASPNPNVDSNLNDVPDCTFIEWLKGSCGEADVIPAE